MSVDFTCTQTSNTREVKFKGKGDFATWEWRWGDGTKGEGKEATHTYTVEGEYYVSVDVADPGTDTTSRTVLVTEPVKARIVATPQKGEAPLEVTFTAETVQGEITAYEWKVDGHPQPGANSSTFIHTFDRPGTYDVSLKVTGVFPLNNTETHWYETGPIQVVVKPKPVELKPSFHWKPQNPQVKQTVTFTGECNPEPAEWKWNFHGDPNSLGGKEVGYAFQDEGIHTVRLTVKDNKGGWSDPVEYQVDVKPVPVIEPARRAAFDWKPMETRTVQFEDKSNIPAELILRWYWDFGDGGQDQQQHPVHQFNEDGIYTVRFSVTIENPAGGETSYPSEKTVKVFTPDFIYWVIADSLVQVPSDPGKVRASFMFRITGEKRDLFTSWWWSLYHSANDSTHYESLHDSSPNYEREIELSAYGTLVNPGSFGVVGLEIEAPDEGNPALWKKWVCKKEIRIT
ncbi:MAG: PKD domain-containing protein [Anaerolineae bacterium]|nr:PKD domain-containing protein [Anaerolineae bacterium]